MEDRELRVGRKIYSLNVGNKLSRHSGQKLTPVYITEIKRKYFTVKDNMDSRYGTQYHVDTLKEKTETCINSKLYFEEQEWLDEKEADGIGRFMFENFPYSSSYPNKLDLPTLRKIKELVDICLKGS